MHVSPPDKGIGKPTTKHGTIVDYLIGSPSLLANIDKFEIHDFDPLFFCSLLLISLFKLYFGVSRK